MTDLTLTGHTLGADVGPEGRRPSRLEQHLRRTATFRRVLYRLSMVFPSFVALLLLFIGVYPLVFAPARSLIPTLASIVGAGLSFASVSFSASRAIDGDPVRTLRLATAGGMLFRFALGMAVVLALATARARVAETFGDANPVDYALRGIMAVVTVAAIGMVYFGVSTLVALLGPEMEEDAARRLASLEPGAAGPSA